MDSRLRGNDTATVRPTTLFLVHFARKGFPRNSRYERAGVFRGGAVDCLTDPGIVCFLAVDRKKHGRMPKTQGREALRGRRRSFGGPDPERTGSRPPCAKRVSADPTRNAPDRGRTKKQDAFSEQVILKSRKAWIPACAGMTQQQCGQPHCFSYTSLEKASRVTRVTSGPGCFGAGPSTV
ncbi:hypothetical protein SAMN05421830_101508 [Desulfomicrobium norvegicum]|uniref:Uncharacterized protein n=1 Tax=Desulfomicrobium norvegicum (strain DSM 1741 / NCIMB 8310) TaxID=52561 RepID=A0A8G2C054_DESNO|nr:hypothetical protein SAMN05421830_101508 [Desulfomicrobium norvegicum]